MYMVHTIFMYSKYLKITFKVMPILQFLLTTYLLLEIVIEIKVSTRYYIFRMANTKFGLFSDFLVKRKSGEKIDMKLFNIDYWVFRFLYSMQSI